MRAYELIVIVHPDLDETAFTEVIERVQGWVTDSGGKVVKTDRWGKRELAYEIRNQSTGQYVLMDLEIAPSFGNELERNLRFQEPVLRHLLVVK